MSDLDNLLEIPNIDTSSLHSDMISNVDHTLERCKQQS